MLVWRTRRRDGSPGAARRRLLKAIIVKGKRQTNVGWQNGGEKTDEPFYHVGTLDDLTREIERADEVVYIVEGEFGVWSHQRLGILHAIGISGISNISKDSADIFTEAGVGGFIYLTDNENTGEKGASNLRTLLHESHWKGAGEYRKFAGAGIPEKGVADDLLCHCFPVLPAGRAALYTLSRFQPRLKRKPAEKPIAPLDGNQEGWDAVNEAITNKPGLIASDFKPNGFTKKNFTCLNPQHENDEAIAGWSRDGFYKCVYCGKIYRWQVAEWLKIDWRALLRPHHQIVS